MNPYFCSAIHLATVSTSSLIAGTIIYKLTEVYNCMVIGCSVLFSMYAVCVRVSVKDAEYDSDDFM